MKEKEKKPKKKSKRQLEKEYVPLTGLMGNGIDYHIYRMTMMDRLKGAGIGFGLAFIVAFVFYRTLWFCIALGVIAAVIAQRPYRNYLNRKRKESLLIQFKDMLEDLATSFAAGENPMGAFSDCQASLTNLYGPESNIVKEVEIIVSGLNNGLNIEDLLIDFARRADLEDIQSFADVFQVSLRQGGNIKQIVADTRSVINDKIEMEMEISSLLNSGKNDINIMIVMPLIIVLMLGTDSSMSITANTFTNVVVKTICIGIFVAAYIIGRKIMNIQV